MFKHFIGLFQSPSAPHSSPNSPCLFCPCLRPVISSLLCTLRLSRGPDGVASLLSRLRDSPGTRECPLICSPFLPGYFLQPLSSTSGGHVLFSAGSPSTVALAPDPLNQNPGLAGATVVFISSLGESSVQPAWGSTGPRQALLQPV